MPQCSQQHMLSFTRANLLSQAFPSFAAVHHTAVPAKSERRRRLLTSEPSHQPGTRDITLGSKLPCSQLYSNASLFLVLAWGGNHQ